MALAICPKCSVCCQSRPGTIDTAGACWQVCFAFGRWFLAGNVQGTASAEALSAQQAEGLRHILTDLGPAFVKIGQVQIGALWLLISFTRSSPFGGRQRNFFSSIPLRVLHPFVLSQLKSKA